MRKKDEIIWILPTILIFILLLMIKFCIPKINKKYVIEKITRENIELFVDMKGTAVASNVTKIGINLNLSVDDVYYKTGDFVKKGDIIVKFSDYQKNNINEKKMLLAIKSSQLRNLEKQKKLGADVNQKIQELQGEISALKLEIQQELKNMPLIQRVVRSPFDAYIVKINALKGGITNENEPVLILARKENLKIVSESVVNEKVKNLNIGNIAEIGISKRENKKAGKEKTLEKLVKIEDGKNKEILSNKNLKESSDLYSEKKIVEGKLFKINKINNMSIFEFFLDSFKELFLNENVDIRVFYQKKENILTVPKQAVVLKNKKSYIYLIDKNNLVKEREVLVGIDNGEKIEVLGTDIEEGMEIVGNPDEKIGNNVIVERKKIQDEELENKRRLEKLEKENEKLENRMNENEREIIRLKRKQ
ncbi:efflux RND transporter periplasmic adaptor subunit [Leptotrichia buccalis]|uniref:Efflux transporter, RND family, MFP subunit n=1 Tax=Leptotrichia buccalis (strain ATCC 14201 / DSM 1135 / JCM 12969 / NCTC 10249 / C-1013-b) TaxID=523794 RepID=C7NEK2_LEPBD|nr:RND family efflux transporter MFP subunit [Leptotrichia buccalis]ACV38363.1 efflux transporter, RND family, MFP subunit [Leptotrichia buccalis C-1013-b]